MKKIRLAAFACFILVIFVLIISTFISSENLYGTIPFVGLWCLLAFLSAGYMFQCRLWEKPCTFLLHVAFLTILSGAFTTWLTGEHGTLTLTKGIPENHFIKKDGKTGVLPFNVCLDQFQVVYYEGTTTPKDYISQLTFTANGAEFHREVSMNNSQSFLQFSFVQASYAPDLTSSTFTISHDPYGVPLSFTGYALLLIGMLFFFIQPGSRYRQILQQRIPLLLFLLLPEGLHAQEPLLISKELSAAFSDLYINYHGRVCPMETYAHDFTTKLYKKQSYRGRTADEILAGWIFYPDTWKSTVEIGADPKHAAEKQQVLNDLLTSSSLKIFPVQQGQHIYWYSFTDKLPDDIDIPQWTFIRRSLDLLAEHIYNHNDAEAAALLQKIKAYQEKVCGEQLPSPTKIHAEKLYNKIGSTKPWAILTVTIGLLAFLYYVRCVARSVPPRKDIRLCLNLVLLGLLLFLSLCMALRTQISGHIPLSNGYETMQALAWCSFVITLCMQRKFPLIIPFGLLTGGMAMMVAMMGQSNPAITHLVPVLQSPLLSLHVMVIMISYALLAFIMLNGITALLMRNPKESKRLQRLSLLMLYPAVFLLTTGIFIGAIWANVSWGRYWGWDPKEVWALITLMIYALPLHGRSLPTLQKMHVFHLYVVLAFFSVLFTYFGVNYLLGGMHSYATM